MQSPPASTTSSSQGEDSGWERLSAVEDEESANNGIEEHEVAVEEDQPCKGCFS
jgi:hypothetical protein